MSKSARRPSKPGKRSASAARKMPDGSLPARPELQRRGMDSPILAYRDQQRLCMRCLRPFSFTAQEQQHWYEVLRFPTFSHPNECEPCRLLLRRARRAQDRLTTLLTAPRPETVEELLEAALLLALLGRSKRAMELHNRARNKLGDDLPQRKAASLLAKYEQALAAPELALTLAPPMRCNHRHLHLLFVVIHEAWVRNRRLPQRDLAMRLLESHRWQRLGRLYNARERSPERLRSNLDSGGYSFALLIMYESMGAFREPGHSRTATDTALLAGMRANLPLTPDSAAEQLHAMCEPLWPTN